MDGSYIQYFYVYQTFINFKSRSFYLLCSWINIVTFIIVTQFIQNYYYFGLSNSILFYSYIIHQLPIQINFIIIKDYMPSFYHVYEFSFIFISSFIMTLIISLLVDHILKPVENVNLQYKNDIV